MKYFTALPLVAGLAAAQMQVMSLAPAASGPVTHTIAVGGLKPVATGMAPFLGYFPEAITANVGDVVLFKFYQKNHTVTQSTFANPCTKMEGGMDSGFMPNPEGKEGVEWNMTVQTTDPLWFYCKQKVGVHCGKGMVFSINAQFTGNKTMAQFKQLAINQNGTAVPLTLAAIQDAVPGAAAAPQTVTIQAGGAGAVASASPTGGASAALQSATVVAGQGKDNQGQACSCQCLCGMNSFPQAAAVNNFGGFPGLLTV